MSNVTEPGRASAVFGLVAFQFNRMQPYLYTELHTILAALFPIVIGAHASLTRPTTAAKPKKRRVSKPKDDVDSESEDEEEQTFQRIEGFSRSDAVWLPLFAGMTLAGLYFLIKWLKDLDVLNKVLNYYFSIMGVFSVCKLIADSLTFIWSFAFPKWYSDSSGVWQVRSTKKLAFNISPAENGIAPRTSPLPGLLAFLPLPSRANNLLWNLRQIPEQKYTFKFYIHRVAAARSHISLLGFIGVLLGLAATAYYNFVEKTWWLTNLLGFAFSYTALQLMSPTTFDTGSLILAALFVYDVIMVFYTPMMVTVAKSLDVPIKLLIPRESDKAGVTQFSMLGLGDVVLPGMMIVMALRFDLYLHYLRLQRTVASEVGDNKTNELVKEPYVPPGKHWADQFWLSSWLGNGPTLPAEVTTGAFAKTYFWTSVFGYIAGMITTLCVMISFKHAQPALLYLVPGVLMSLWGMALLKGDFNLMWEYTEADEDEPDVQSSDTDKDGKKTKAGGSFFSDAKMERNEARLKTAISSFIERDQSGGEDADAHEKSKEKVEKAEKTMHKGASHDLFYFGVSRYSTKAKKQSMAKWSNREDGVDYEHGRKRQRTG